YNFRILYIKGLKNIKINAFNRKSKYLENKIYKSRAIFKINQDSLVFNKL
ncbi:hypothetical protein NA56DRAFT_585921, partial [Hyaloscypha hepaticicola]